MASPGDREKAHPDLGERPLGVTIVSILIFMDGFIMLMIGLGYGLRFFETPEIFIGFFWFFSAAVAMILSWGLWQKKHWALFGTLVAMGVAAAGLIGGWIGLIPPGFRGGIAGAFVQDVIISYYLLRPHVRAWFARAPSLPPPPPK